ncbi:SUMF1/EgtB/PvdO family nonheme iron enzyme [Fulvivirgaceae bacterium BMA12]|uniref:SUMF1/EgtB/PvdO family nonheme iron enzyme n=1 Tax=Agaribacillus aureus TaxID=3051825 RepID=A0ABT8L806_9BACT|nr:SUMF1/EgtB/PvdO family nonheme iron enzyme [Fulvivirgaceae bacterium BMA12]
MSCQFFAKKVTTVIILFSLLFLISQATDASNIRIYNKYFRILPDRKTDGYLAINKENYPDLKHQLTFSISWDHSWRTKRNYDAAWVFIKLSPDADAEFSTDTTGCFHATITSASIIDTPSGGPKGKISLSEDGLGFFIYPDELSRGKVTWTVSVTLSSQDIYRFGSPFGFDSEVNALEMVYIPKAPFYLGAADEEMLGLGAYYKSGTNGAFKGPFKIESESSIPVGSEKDQLWYHNFGGPISQGDHEGPIPGTFPKGYEAFYIMKYELTQGQYADFLNALKDYGTDLRSIIGGRSYRKNRGTIKVQDHRYIAEDPNRPANYLNWGDVMSYLDWAALRPMTELEMEKSSRGPGFPVPKAYAWGNDHIGKLQRGYFDDGSFGMLNGMHEGQLVDENRAVFGASYYWVMDLCGGLAEPVIAASTKLGRKFKGSHGDGMVEITYAEKGNEDWPALDKLAPNQKADGGGFKGGGVFSNNEVGNDTHPFDPVSSRYGVDRSFVMVYRSSFMGCRGVRTATPTP